jgi:uncharacterized membrane protein
MRLRELLRRRSPVEIAFAVSVSVKGLDGVLEIVGGVLVLFTKPETIGRLIIALTQHELSEDRHDVIAGYLVRIAHQFSAGSQGFAGVYLLSHGAIKVFLVEALLRGRRWAYPTAIVFFMLFIIYQMYRYSLQPSIGMIVLSVLDVIVIVLTWLEYGRLKRASGSTSTSVTSQRSPRRRIS